MAAQAPSEESGLASCGRWRRAISVQLDRVGIGHSRLLQVGQVARSAVQTDMICPIPKLTVPTFRRARCVPDETANHGYWQSLADTSAHQLTCERTGPRMAAHVLLSNRSGQSRTVGDGEGGDSASTAAAKRFIAAATAWIATT